MGPYKKNQYYPNPATSGEFPQYLAESFGPSNNFGKDVVEKKLVGMAIWSFMQTDKSSACMLNEAHH